MQFVSFSWYILNEVITVFVCWRMVPESSGYGFIYDGGKVSPNPDITTDKVFVRFVLEHFFMYLFGYTFVIIGKNFDKLINLKS